MQYVKINFISSKEIPIGDHIIFGEKEKKDPQLCCPYTI